MKDRIKILLFALALAGLTLLSACSEKEPEAHSENLPSREVEVATLQRVPVPSLIEVSGTLQAVDSAQISARVSGQVTKVPVRAGSRVKKGDLLVQISAAEIAAQAQRAETQLAQAQRNLEREEKLLQAGASTRETVRSLREAVQINEAGLREARAMLGYTKIEAPFDALVTQKLIEVGDLAAPGKPLVLLENGSLLEVVVQVPEALVKNLQPGSSLQTLIPAAGLALEATVTEVAPTVDPRTRTTRVKLGLPDDSRLRSGQFARVSLPSSEVETLLMDAAALRLNGQLEQVFVAEAGKAHLRLVRSGRRYGAQVEILSGLEAGEQVVTSAEGRLRDGQPVILNNNGLSK